MPKDEVILLGGRKRVAFDVGDSLTLGGLDRAWKFMRQRNAAEVMVWHQGRPVIRMYGIKDIETLIDMRMAT